MKKSNAETWRDKLAAALDRAAHDIFDLARWIAMVGFSRFLWINTGQFVFALLYWVLSATLFGFLASRLLLRTDFVVFAAPDKRWQVLINMAVNFGICVVAFAPTLWFVELLTIAFAESRAS